MKHRMKRKGSAKRFLSILLAVVMVLSLAPDTMLTLTAYAEESIVEEAAEQDEIDLTPCILLQEELDGANAAMPLAGEYNISSKSITINSDNKNTYDGATITGSATDKHITVSGTTVSLTIKDLSIRLPYNDGTDKNLMHAGIELENNATLNLTLEGTNTITGGNQFPGIHVPEGCTLTITKASTGSLTATGGSGSAGIGGRYTAGTTGQTVGDIIINGGTVRAYGTDGGAGIGGASYDTTGSVTINGGTVYAEGSAIPSPGNPRMASGIGSGFEGYLSAITINGGNVTAKGVEKPLQSSSYSGTCAIGAGYTARHCGNITINGGTINAQGKRGCAIGLSSGIYSGSGSVTIAQNKGVRLNLNGGKIFPVPNGWSSYTVSGAVYDESLTNPNSAVLTIGGVSYDIGVQQGTEQPYYWTFSANLFAEANLTGDATLKIGGKSYTATPQVNGNAVTLSFGTQEYLYSTLNVTLYDRIIESDMDVTLTCGSKTWSGRMKKSAAVPYCGTFTANQLILRKSDGPVVLTVTSGDNTWTTDVTPRETMNVTIGQREYAYCSLNITIHDESITENQKVQVDIGGRQYSATLTKKQEYIGNLSFSNCILSLDQMESPLEVTVAGSKTWTGTAPAGASRELTIGTPYVSVDFKADLSYGDVKFSEQDGTLQVTYKTADGASRTQSLNRDVVYEVIQSDSNATGYRLTFNTSGGVHVRVRDVNMSNDNNSPIEISGRGKVTLETAGSSTVQCSKTNTATVRVSSGSTLELAGNGILTVRQNNTESGGAGIGGNKSEDSGEIIISSGTVNATGGKYGAGIGGSQNGAGNVKITGGTVTATGGDSGAGIGGGNGNRGNVTITGGTVKANGKGYGAGIGGGNGNPGYVTITGGTVTAKGDIGGAGIGGGKGNNGNVTINGGTVTATGGGAGIGGGENGSGTVTINGGTITAKGGYAGDGIGGTKDTAGTKGQESNKVTITGGTIYAQKATNGGYGLSLKDVSFPKDKSGTDLKLSAVTLEGAGKNILITDVTLSDDTVYGVKDVCTRDGGKLYFYLKDGIYPESIMAGGVKYVPESAGSLNYVEAFRVSLKDYTGKTYDGTALANPTASQVESNVAYSDLKFTWYQNEEALTDIPVNVGDYTLKVSYGSDAKEFSITIAQKSLTITAKDQSIVQGEEIETGTAWVDCDAPAEGDTLESVTLTASQTGVGTYAGGITVSDAVIMNGDTNVTANYDITYTAGSLTIEKVTYTYEQLQTLIADVNTKISNGTYKNGYTTASVKALSEALVNAEKITDHDADENINNAYDTLSNAVQNLTEAAYTVTLNADPLTGGTLYGGGSFAEGEDTKINAVPATGYTFAGWYLGTDTTGTPVSVDATYTVAAGNEAVTYTAKFTLTNTLSVDTIGSGTVYLNGESITANYLQPTAVGTEIILKAVANDGYEFVYWMDENYRILSYTADSYTTCVGTATTIKAVFQSTATSVDNKWNYRFLNHNGKVITSDSVAENSKVTPPASNPGRIGYTFKGWKIQGTSDAELVDVAEYILTSNIIFVAVYEKEAKEYTVTVAGGTISGTDSLTSGGYVFDTRITVVADTKADGSEFSYWQNRAGEVVSYDASYTFYVGGNTYLTAVFEETPAEAVPVISGVIAKIDSENNISFLFDRSTPDGYTMVQTGCIATDDATLGTDANTFVLGADGIDFTKKATSTDGTGQYMWTKSNISSTWYVRGYLTYKDKNGVIVTIYTDILSCSLSA